VLSTFFWGYIALQVPAGWIAARFGGRLLNGTGLILSSLLTLLTPALALLGVEAIAAVRALEGLAQALVFPGIQSMMARWAPERERGILNTTSLSGLWIGSMASLALSGWLSEQEAIDGWRSAFYIIGAASVVVFVLWMTLVSDGPELSTTISEYELQYVRRTCTAKHDRTQSIGWFYMLTRPAVWALIVTQTCNNFGFALLTTWMPSWLTLALGLDTQTASLVATLPYLAMFFGFLINGALQDALVRRGFTATFVRKLFIAAGGVMSCVGFLCENFVSDNVPAAVALMMLATFGIATAGSAYVTVAIDIGGQFAGIVFSLSNSASTGASVVFPVIIGAVLDAARFEGDELAGWVTIFYTLVGIHAFGAVFFLALGSARQQFG